MRAPMLACLMAVTAALLHPTAAEDLSQVSGRRTVIVCDQFTGLLRCPPNSLIEVQEAFFGRMDKQYCATGPGIDHTGCSLGSRALTVARAKCNNRQSCQIDSLTTGDPCPGVYKYMRLAYSCRAIPTAVACDDTRFKITCPAGKYIWIRDGFFGRVSDEHCNRGPRTDYTCTLPTAGSIIAGRCNNRQMCEFDLTVMPDPCYGTFKYITAAYECLDHETQVTCDGFQILPISCPLNKVIRVKRGFIGRNSEEYCSHGPRYTFECSSATAHLAISNLCNGKRSCSPDPAGLVPDPCPNTLKMTIVEYHCV